MSRLCVTTEASALPMTTRFHRRVREFALESDCGCDRNREDNNRRQEAIEREYPNFA